MSYQKRYLGTRTGPNYSSPSPLIIRKEGSMPVLPCDDTRGKFLRLYKELQAFLSVNVDHPAEYTIFVPRRDIC